MLIFPSTKHTTDFPNTGNLTHHIHCQIGKIIIHIDIFLKIKLKTLRGPWTFALVVDEGMVWKLVDHTERKNAFYRVKRL